MFFFSFWLFLMAIGEYVFVAKFGTFCIFALFKSCKWKYFFFRKDKKDPGFTFLGPCRLRWMPYSNHCVCPTQSVRPHFLCRTITWISLNRFWKFYIPIRKIPFNFRNFLMCHYRVIGLKLFLDLFRPHCAGPFPTVSVNH